MIELTSKEQKFGPMILVVGIGGGGNNAVERMLESATGDVDYAVINTDQMVLNSSRVETRLQIGERLTGGYGAGADPQVGEAAAIENEDEIRALVSKYDMIIITAGMGGGTGTGASPIVAKIAHEESILVVAVVTTPFQFESSPRIVTAENGIEKLKEFTDTLLVIPNNKLLKLQEKPLKLDEAFFMADSVLKYAVEGITNIVFNEGMVNIDFNDLKATIKGKGIGHFGLGIVEEGEPIIDAVKQAINSPLLDTTIVGASNILLNTSGSVDVVSLSEAAGFVRETAGMNVNLIWGTVAAKDQSDKIVVTLIATGMPDQSPQPADELTQTFNPAPDIPGNRNTWSFAQPISQENVEMIKIPDFLKNHTFGS